MQRALFRFGLATVVLTLVSLATSVRAASAIPAATIVDPATLHISDLAADFGAAAPHVRAIYAQYAAAARARRLGITPVQTVKTVDGKTIDLKAAFTFVNQLNIALLLEKKKPLTALAAHDAIPATSDASLDRARTILRTTAGLPKPVLEIRPTQRAPVTALAPPPPAPVPSDAKPCTQTGASPAPFDPDAAWSELAHLAVAASDVNAPLDRCALSFVRTLELAELGTPLAPEPRSIPIALPAFFQYGDNRFGAEMKPGYSYTNGPDATILHAEAVIGAHAPGFNGKLNLFSVATDVRSPAVGTPTITVAIAAAQSPVYTGTFAATQAVPFDLNAIAPTQDVMLFDPVKLHVNSFLPVPFGIGIDAELDAVGRIGFNGHVTTSNLGVYVRAKPVVSMGIRGDLVANALFASARIDGTLYFVNVTGDLGFIAVLVPDRTASMYLPTTLATKTPVLAMYRPFGNVNYAAASGDLTVTARLAGFITVWTHSFPISIKGLQGKRQVVDQDWTAVYVTNAAETTLSQAR